MKILELDPNSIKIPAERQRKDLGDLEGLKESIKTRGQIQPIVVRIAAGSIWLVAGERRLTAFRELNLLPIFARDWSDLTPDEAELIELEENTRRKDLHWTELAEAIQKIHQIKLKTDPTWTNEATAHHLGYASASGTVKHAIALTGQMNDRLKTAPTMESAYNTVARVQERRFSDITNELLAPAPRVSVPSSAQGPSDSPVGSAPVPKLLPAHEDIAVGSFLDWAPGYTGPKFNLLHCDFPYGIDLGESDQMKHEQETIYDDSKEIYWALLESFAKNLDTFCFPSAHLMFWFSMEYYTETVEFLRTKTDFTILSRPLVWHKSDNSGIMPDHRRRPRNTYEVALLGARGDRFILEPVSSSYSAPTASRKLHPSEKPEPMLKHFFRMFVDENTALLDPTAGGGSALRAADDMGAGRVFGLELNPEFAGAANGALRQSRAKRRAAAAAV